MVLRSAERLHALPRSGGSRVDISGHGARAHEGDAGNARVAQERFDYLPPPVDHVQHPRREPRRPGQLHHALMGERVLLARLQDEGIAGRDRIRPEPQGDHHGEVVGGDPGKNPDRLAKNFAVDPVRHVLERVSHHEGGDPARVLDVLDPPLHLSTALGHALPMLQGQRPSQRLLVLIKGCLQSKEDPSPIYCRGRPPPGEGSGCRRDGLVHLVSR